ncbi:hypothetical protein MRX96_019288 [Rhipicephalus microplus]
MGRLVSDASVALRRNGPQPSANRTTESSGVFMLVSYPASTDAAAVAHASASCSAKRAAPAEVADSAPLVTLAPASTRSTALAARGRLRRRADSRGHLCTASFEAFFFFRNYSHL